MPREPLHVDETQQLTQVPKTVGRFFGHHAFVQIPVPDDAGLLGLRLDVQALMTVPEVSPYEPSNDYTMVVGR